MAPPERSASGSIVSEIMVSIAFTFRTFRGRGLLSVVEREMLRDAKREGAHIAYTHVEEDNIASIKGVIKTGFAPYGVVTFNRLVGVAWTHWRPANPTPFEVAHAIGSR